MKLNIFCECCYVYWIVVEIRSWVEECFFWEEGEEVAGWGSVGGGQSFWGWSVPRGCWSTSSGATLPPPLTRSTFPTVLSATRTQSTFSTLSTSTLPLPLHTLRTSFAGKNLSGSNTLLVSLISTIRIDLHHWCLVYFWNHSVTQQITIYLLYLFPILNLIIYYILIFIILLMILAKHKLLIISRGFSFFFFFGWSWILFLKYQLIQILFF